MRKKISAKSSTLTGDAKEYAVSEPTSEPEPKLTNEEKGDAAEEPTLEPEPN